MTETIDAKLKVCSSEHCRLKICKQLPECIIQLRKTERTTLQSILPRFSKVRT